jgi:hypothetical protein
MATDRIADCQLPIAGLQRVIRIVKLRRVIEIETHNTNLNRQSAIDNWQ